MKYQALRPQFFSVGGWGGWWGGVVVGGWGWLVVVRWVVMVWVDGGGDAEWRGGG